jgi:hypothetical protein
MVISSMLGSSLSHRLTSMINAILTKKIIVFSKTRDVFRLGRWPTSGPTTDISGAVGKSG